MRGRRAVNLEACGLRKQVILDRDNSNGDSFSLPNAIDGVLDTGRGICSGMASVSRMGSGVISLPCFAWISFQGTCCVLSPLLLRNYFSHFDVDLRFLPVMRITGEERSKEAKPQEDGRRAAWARREGIFNDQVYR